MPISLFYEQHLLDYPLFVEADDLEYSRLELEVFGEGLVTNCDPLIYVVFKVSPLSNYLF